MEKQIKKITTYIVVTNTSKVASSVRHPKNTKTPIKILFFLSNQEKNINPIFKFKINGSDKAQKHKNHYKIQEKLFSCNSRQNHKTRTKHYKSIFRKLYLTHDLHNNKNVTFQIKEKLHTFTHINNEVFATTKRTPSTKYGYPHED